MLRYSATYPAHVTITQNMANQEIGVYGFEGLEVIVSTARNQHFGVQNGHGELDAWRRNENAGPQPNKTVQQCMPPTFLISL